MKLKTSKQVWYPVIVTFCLVIAMTLLFSASLYQSAKSDWRKSALSQVDGISRIFTYWIDIEVGYINSISASFYTFPEVKYRQLSDFMLYSRMFSQSQNLISVGTVGENKQGKLEILYASQDTPWIYKGMLLDDRPSALNTVDNLLLDTGQLLLGPIVKLGNDDAVVYVASLAPSDNLGGILLTYLPLSDMLQGLRQVYLPEGVSLGVTSLTDVAPSDEVVVSNSIKKSPSLSYTQRIFHSNVDWVLQWHIHPNYKGGINGSAAQITLYGGGLLAIVLSIIVYVLKSQANQIREKVERQTKELKDQNDALIKTQQELVQAEKMASLGSLVAGVAHELNTPLGISLTGISLLREKLKELQSSFNQNKLSKSKLAGAIDSFEESSTLIETSISRSVELISNFKMVAVDQTSDRRRQFFLAQSVNEIVGTLNHKLNQSHVTLVLDVDESISLDSYPGSLVQILSNLILNSLIHGFAGKDSGEISLQAQLSQNVVTLTYRDNGKGIAEKHLDKVFNPFYTTSLGQGGSGLGLNIVYNLVHNALGGKISLSSDEGQGVCFVLELPLVAPQNHPESEGE